MKTTRKLTYALSLAIASLMITNAAQTMVYHVEIIDMDPGQPITPPVAVVHDQDFQLFTLGTASSAGLEALAEDGMTDPLVDEISSNPSVKEIIIGGHGPTFATFKFLVEGEEGDLFSFASMFAKTNDTFVGVSGVTLPPVGAPLMIDTEAYDAGTEDNTGLAEHIPAFGNEGVGPTENGTVQIINSFTLQDDPGATEPVQFTWPPAAKVIITAMPDAVRYSLTLTNLSDGQALTPVVIAVHNADAHLFVTGEKASAGLEEVAESGAPNTLVSELIPTAGVWNVSVAGDGPGLEQTTTFIAEPGNLVSAVSMFARTNDVFTGVHDIELPEAGMTVSMDTNAYDAGTEPNTGLMVDVPFYMGTGSPVEDGVISMINDYTIVDDPEGELMFSWPPAAHLVITATSLQSGIQDWTLYN